MCIYLVYIIIILETTWLANIADDNAAALSGQQKKRPQNDKNGTNSEFLLEKKKNQSVLYIYIYICW